MINIKNFNTNKTKILILIYYILIYYIWYIITNSVKHFYLITKKINWYIKILFSIDWNQNQDKIIKSF